MTIREEFEKHVGRGQTVNDGDYALWLIRQIGNAEFSMGEADKDEVQSPRYQALLDRVESLACEIMAFFPVPVDYRHDKRW